MNGFWFKVNSAFVDFVAVLNPTIITEYPQTICGNSISCIGPPAVFFIITEGFTKNEVEKYTHTTVWYAMPI